MNTERKHPEYQIPNEPHAKQRYESALKHVQLAREAGKTSEEIHEIFRKVINFDSKNIENISQDEAHKKYRTAVIHARKSLENGKTPEEAHEVYRSILSGNTAGKCHHKVD